MQPSSGPRVIRVFVSSTFRDMQAERDLLVKRVFPALRRLCEQRGVSFTEVDLRWGITEEQSRQTQTLPICLEEITRCRPYFIGLLGERYGWVPDALPPGLTDAAPWLAGSRDRSVTELEILHGVLNDPQMRQHAFFYFRAPRYISTLPPEQQADYRSPVPADQLKLAELKERIRHSGYPVVDGYPDPASLADLVLADLTAVIDRLYPEGSAPDPLDREAAEHAAFAASRAQVYVGRPEYMQRLDEAAAGQGPPLVILGESGMGKTALLANWALQYQTAHPEQLVLLHFIGASPGSTAWDAMLRRIMGDLQRRFGIPGAIPDQPAALRQTFPAWLHMAGARGKVVLILDGLNQLEERDGAPDLAWLPSELPPGVRLVLSTLPGRALTALQQRRWPTLTVGPLTEAERLELIQRYLAQYRKALDQRLLQQISTAPQAANPHYLRALLEELRLHGVHETLPERIEFYLRAATPARLYELILQRYEQDYEGGRPGLVGELMSLLWTARRGLSEAELLDLLGTPAGPLPRADFAPLHLAAAAALVDRSGLLGFAHDYLRQAVERRYLPEAAQQRAARLRLADYFESREAGRRQIEELPWQLERAGDWERLYRLLAQPAFAAAAFGANPYELKQYWATVEQQSPHRMAEAYQDALAGRESLPARVAEPLALLLADCGHPAEALLLQQALEAKLRATGARAPLQACLTNQAVIFKERGDLNRAMELLKEQEQICRELDHREGLAACLGNQAGILHLRGDLDGAEALHREEERLCRELGDQNGLQACLGNRALIRFEQNDLDGADALLTAQERICRELGNPDSSQACLGNQAAVRLKRGDLAGALPLLQAQERLCRELWNPIGLSDSLGNQGLVRRRQGDLEGAMRLFKEQERLCREAHFPLGLQASLGNQAGILQQWGDSEGALSLHREEERICRKAGYRDGLKAALRSQALMLMESGDSEAALPLLQEHAGLCRALGQLEELALSLGEQGTILDDLNQLDQALDVLREQAQLARRLRNADQLAVSLGNQALVLLQFGQSGAAVAAVEEAWRAAAAAGLVSRAAQMKQFLDQLRQ